MGWMELWDVVDLIGSGCVVFALVGDWMFKVGIVLGVQYADVW